MKKIGKEVLFIRTGEKNPRNGEGTFVRLLDGRLMHLYTEYCGNAWVDHAVARLSACYSSDEGESWSAPTVCLEKDEKAENIMSPSLFRMKNGELGMVYLRKAHIGEIQASIWPEEMRNECAENGMPLI